MEWRGYSGDFRVEWAAVTMEVQSFFEAVSCTFSYVVWDTATRRAAVIDSVLDYDAAAGRTSTRSADRIIDFAREHDLGVDWVLETHVHADHFSAAPHIQRALGGTIAIGGRVREVQDIFGKLFNVAGEFKGDGRPFEHLFGDGETFRVGSIAATAMATPGHTPACVTYLIGDAAFVGDTLFMPDYGTARCDFPGGDARTLYRSIQRILALPSATRLFLCHDYLAPGRDTYSHETTVAAERGNRHLKDGVSEDAYVAMRQARDATLATPHLLLPAVQVNMRAGNLPAVEANGTAYLKIPLNQI